MADNFAKKTVLAQAAKEMLDILNKHGVRVFQVEDVFKDVWELINLTQIPCLETLMESENPRTANSLESTLTLTKQGFLQNSSTTD